MLTRLATGDRANGGELLHVEQTGAYLRAPTHRYVLATALDPRHQYSDQDLMNFAADR
jgi:hypothetical protein